MSATSMTNSWAPAMFTGVGDGPVAFVEFFSELDGGGISAGGFLGDVPFFTGNSEWQSFSFTTFAGPDVSGGVTLQFNAVTGGVPGSASVLTLDNVSVQTQGGAVPEPTSATLLGLGSLALLIRRRR